MGLLKDIDTDTGVVVSYWKINTVIVDMAIKSMRVKIDGYLNKQACLDGKSAIETRERMFYGDDNPFSAATAENPVVALIYQLVQALPEFSEAVFDNEV